MLDLNAIEQRANPDFAVRDALSMAKNIRDTRGVASKVYTKEGLHIALLKLADEIWRLEALAVTWRMRATNAAANGSDARARALAECADEVEGK